MSEQSSIRTPQTRFELARFWTMRGLTASLLIFTALLPSASVLMIEFLLEGQLHWQRAALELGVACLTLACIAYPAFYLLNWEARQQKRLDETQQDFELLINNVVDMVFLVSFDGKIIDVNQYACDTLNYSKKALTKLSMMDLDIDCYLHRHPALMEDLKQGKGVIYETHYRCAAGEKIPVECRARAANWLPEPHYVEFVTDITARRNAEKAMGESKEALEKARNLLEQRVAEHSSEIEKQKHGREVAERYADAMHDYLEKLIDSMPSAIIAVDDNDRVVQWNQAAEKMTRIRATNAIGINLANLFPALDVELKQQKRSPRLDHSLTFQFKARLHQQTRLLDVVVYPIFAMRVELQGEVIRIDDITEKVKIDETLVQTEKMLSLGGLAAGMAHEINNPLGAITQSTQNIKRRLSFDLPRNRDVAQETGLNIDALERYLTRQRIFDFLDGITSSGERAAHIVADMLSFSRPSNQKSQLVDVREAMDTAIRLASKDHSQRKQFDFREIEIRKTYSPEVGLVQAQKNQLEQVFLNLLINAAQAIAEVKLDGFLPLIEVIIRRDGNDVCIEVIDNGTGMDDNTRKRAFEPFFTTKDELVGTGLGLSVSYFIVSEQLKGKMSVVSQLDIGSRFTLMLPLISTPKQDPSEDEQIELPL